MAIAPYALVSPARPVEPGDASPPRKTAYFLHGILGSGGNLRTLAKRVLELSPGWEVILVDLPGHGRSEPMPAPHTLTACKDAVLTLATALEKPIGAVVGHSFGGKVALVLAEALPQLRACCTLDSTPGARHDRHGSESTLGVLQALRMLPDTFATRADFATSLRDAGLAEDLVAWLSLNLAATDTGAFRFRLDLDVIDALLDDYFARDCWPVLEAPRETHFAIVIGGASGVWDEADRERALRLQAASGEHVTVTEIPGASHWLHVDALEATAKAIAANLAHVP